MTTSTMNESLMRITYNQITMTKKVCNNNGVINNGRNITFINMIFFIVTQNYYILDASVKFVFSNTFLKFGRLIHLNFTTTILFFDSWDFRNSIFFQYFHRIFATDNSQWFTVIKSCNWNEYQWQPWTLEGHDIIMIRNGVAFKKNLHFFSCFDSILFYILFNFDNTLICLFYA